MTLATCMTKLRAANKARLDPDIETSIDRQIRREMRARRDAIMTGRVTEQKARSDAEKRAVDDHLAKIESELGRLEEEAAKQSVEPADAPRGTQENRNERQAEEAADAGQEGLLKKSGDRVDYSIKSNKDGTIVVTGNIDAVRAVLPEGIMGRKIGDGLAFTVGDAHRVKAALEGRANTYSRGGKVVEKWPVKDGKYVGAPPGFDTPGAIGRWRKMLRTLTDEGAPGRYWYENSSKAILQMTGGDVVEAKKFVATLAIYSPQAKVDANSTFALRAWAQYKAGQPIKVKTGVQDRQATEILYDNKQWGGEKTGNFFNNLLREIDPSTAGNQGATIDMWMMRAGRYPTDAPTKNQYAFMENETNRIAAQLGWEPQQVQAAIWVAMKARMENSGVKKRTEASSEKNGWMRYDYPLKDGKPKKTRVVIDAQKHRDNWLAESFKLNVSAEDTNTAKFDFSDGVRRHIGQVSWEARPGRSTGVLPGVNDAPYDQQLEFQQAVSAAFYGPEGEDQLAHRLGLLADDSVFAPGVWQGEVAAGQQNRIAMAPAAGDDGKSNVDPVQHKLLDAYASVIGWLTHQEGVGWHRPFYATAKKDANGLDIDVGRGLTADEMLATEAAIGRKMEELGVADWQNGLGLISSPVGVRVVSFGAVENSVLQNDVMPAIADVLPDHEWRAFASDGNLVTNDWKANPDGQEYVQRVGAEGRSDVLKWAADNLAPRIEKVFADFSEKYGWGDPGRPARDRLANGPRAEGPADEVKRSTQRQTDTPAFKKWFGDSVVTNPDGTPKVMYHGTAADISTFKAKQAGAIFVTDKPKFAESFADSSMDFLVTYEGMFPSSGNDRKKDIAETRKLLRENGYTKSSIDALERDNEIDETDEYRQVIARRIGSGPNLMPLFVKTEKPWDYQNDADVAAVVSEIGKPPLRRLLATGEWGMIEDDGIQAAMKKLGYDGFYVKEGGIKNLAVFEPTQLKSAIGNQGTFDGADGDIRRSTARAPSRWSVDEPSKLDAFVRTMQDKHVDLKRVVQAVDEQVGAIEDKYNPYLQEELYHGRTAKQTSDFLKGDLKRLLNEMRLRKISIEDLGKFLHARHAEERNKRMAAINPNDPDMQDGGSGMTTKDAKAYLSGLSPDQRKAYDALAARVDAINKGTQALLVSSGLEKQSTIDAWNAAYKHYVPLQRDDVGDSGMGTGQGYSVRGSSSKRAMGSKKDVIDILANVTMQRERAIIRAEKNRVAQALWGLAAKAPNPDLWVAVSQNDDPVKIEADLIKMGMNPIDAAGVAKEPQQRYIDPRTGNVMWRVNPMLRSAPNVISMRVDGEERYVIMNEKSDRAKAMSAAVKNLDADQMGQLLSVSAKISRYFAAINTQWNPLFGPVNMIRDTQGAALNLSTTAIAGKQKDVLRNTMFALKGIYADLRNQRAGKPATSAWATLFEEFQKEGGQTGFRDMFANSADRAKALESEFRKATENKGIKSFRAVFDWLTDYNDAMENAVRLAAYKVAKDNGQTKQQAASIAKNLTVNFNRKGNVALQAGSLYAFFNASAQGTARLASTLFDMKGGDIRTARLSETGKKILYGGILLGSAQAVMLAAAGFDGDEPPEFVRERNLIIPIGDKKYITIPMPLGLHIIPNLGRIPTELALSGFKKPGERMVSMFAVLADAFNPIGNAGMSIQTIAPTAVDPLVALAENKDFAGRPISRQDFSSLNPQPGHLRARDTATAWSKGISYALNLMTGGTDYKPGAFSPSPDQLDYLIGQVTGGVGRELSKGAQAAFAVKTGEDLPPHKIPLLGRFYGDTDVPSAQASKFYEHVKELNAHKSEIDGRLKAGQPVGDYLRENPEFALIPLSAATQRQIAELKKMKKQLVDRGNDRAAKAIEDQITLAMRTLNERYKAIEAR